MYRRSELRAHVGAVTFSWLAALGVADARRALAEESPAARPASYSSVVRAAGGPPQAVSAAVDASQARLLAGSGGDPLLGAQNLAGVARPAPGATGLVVWGAAPTESRVLFEGIEIPALYHFGGFRSTVGAELVGRVEIVPAAFSAEYGRAIGGLVRVDGRPPEMLGEGETSVLRFSLDASALDTSVAARASHARGVDASVALRASYLQETYGRFVPRDSSALFPIPRYADGQIDLRSKVGTSGQLRLLALASQDEVTRAFGGDTAGPSTHEEHLRQRWWRAGLAYAERGDDDGIAALLYLGGERNETTLRFGGTPAFVEQRALELGSRARYRVTLDAHWQTTLGIDALLTDAHVKQAGSATIPAREGDITTFGQPPGDDVNADDWRVRSGNVGAFATALWRAGAWTFSPGVRLDAFPVDGDRVLPPVGNTPRAGFSRLGWALDPRAAVTFTPRPGVILRAAGGRYHQPSEARDLSAVFGNPSLGPSQAWHAVVGAWARLAENVSCDVDAFHRRLGELPRRSPLGTPLLAEALTDEGAGRVWGVSATLRRELDVARDVRTHGWLTYTLSRSERSSSDGGYRLFDGDQTHGLTAVLSHQRGAWSFSARARYATGTPRTPVIGTFLDTRDQRYQPLFGAHNTARLPAFLQLDARLDRTFELGRVRLTLSLDVQNLTARKNAEEIVYTQDYRQSGHLDGLPLLVLFNVRLDA